LHKIKSEKTDQDFFHKSQEQIRKICKCKWKEDYTLIDEEGGRNSLDSGGGSVDLD